jgi:hypothetical protein
MTMRLALLLALCVAAPLAHAQSAVFSFPQGATVELDGRYYVMLGGTLSASTANGYVANAPLSMSNCQRPGGAAFVTTTRPFSWGSPTNVIFLTTANNPDGTNGIRVWVPFDRVILRLRSSTGDLVCGGDVPTPPGLDTIFRSGFE